MEEATQELDEIMVEYGKDKASLKRGENLIVKKLIEGADEQDANNLKRLREKARKASNAQKNFRKNQ